MIASEPPPNRLLRLLDTADFDLLRPHLTRIELVRETVLEQTLLARTRQSLRRNTRHPVEARLAMPP